MKKISKFLLLSAFFAGIFGVSLQKDKAVLKTEAAAKIPLGTKFYLKPNPNWKEGSAVFQIYFMGDGDGWVSMTEYSGDTDYYVGTMSISGKNFDGLIFVRTDPNGPFEDWKGKWNQTGDLTYNADKRVYEVPDGWWDTSGDDYWKSIGDAGILEEDPVVTHTITKYRGATTIGTEDVLDGESYTPSFVYQQGYKLEGWYTDSGLTTPYVVGSISGNISLYGKYVSAEDYYVYFRKPDDWGPNVNAYYYREGAGIPLGEQGSDWEGDPMVDVMGGGHGYVVKIDAGYNANMIIFNDGPDTGDGGTNKQTGNTPLVPGKVYTFFPNDESDSNPDNVAVPHDFEYRLLKSWAPWDDLAEDFADNYVVGSEVKVAIKAGDTVKMNISSHIYAPFNKLSGANVATYFEANDGDDNYKALVSGVYKFTYNQDFVLGVATETKTAQITADNSTIAFELVTVENDKIAAVDARIADINTCVEYADYADYVAFVKALLGEGGMTLISEQNQAKLDLMSRYIVAPPATGGGMASATRSTSVSVVFIIGLLGLTTIAGFYFLQKKKYS